MKNLQCIIILSFTSILASCNFNDRFKYWSIEHFELDEQVLIDQDKVKVIYASPTPENAKGGIQAYKHLVVISQNSGDTINLLSLNREQIKLNKTYTFQSQKQIVEKLNLNAKVVNQVGDLKKEEFKPLSAVVRVPDHDDITDNSHPSTIGICKL